MPTPILSIIIPVYNVEEYIEECIESLYSSNIAEHTFEIIIVNDGSQDDSIGRINNYLVSHNNIKLINQENQGVSVARNTGIEHSRGKYLTFVDPDDKIDANSLPHLLSILQNGYDEILVVKSYIISGREIFAWSRVISPQKKYKGIDLYSLGYVRGSVCGAFFLREFINSYNIRFIANIKNAEDSIFWTICQLHSELISFYNLNFYIVREREGSASRSFPLSQLESYNLALDYLSYYRTSLNLFPWQYDLLSSLQYRIISALTYRAISIGQLKYGQVIKLINLDRFLPIKFFNFTNKIIKILILNKSYKLFFLINKFLYCVRTCKLI